MCLLKELTARLRGAPQGGSLQAEAKEIWECKKLIGGER